MLTENKSSANSSFGVNRKIAANYRGMTDEERDEILTTQKFQQMELNVSFKQWAVSPCVYLTLSR